MDTFLPHENENNLFTNDCAYCDTLFMVSIEIKNEVLGSIYLEKKC